MDRLLHSISLEQCVRAAEFSGTLRLPNDTDDQTFSSFPTTRKLQDTTLQQTDSPNDPYFHQQWYLMDSNPFSVKAQAAWQITGGIGTIDEEPLNTIGVIDSFFFINQDIESRTFQNPREECGNGIDDDGNGLVDDCLGWNFVANSKDLSEASTIEDGRSGTAVAGLVAAETNNGIGLASVCPHCRVLPVSTALTTENILLGTNYIISLGIKVVTYTFDSSYNTVIAELVRNNPQTTFVIPAGDGDCNINSKRGDCEPYFPGMLGFLNNTIVVTGHNSSGQVARNANYGPKSVTVSAPGESITTLSVTENLVLQTRVGGKTSLAAALVAGIVGLMRSIGPTLTPCQIRESIIETVTPQRSVIGLIKSGGFVNAELAIKRALKVDNQLLCLPQGSNAVLS